MNNTPKANRVHIAVFGKRNAGKSSLINTITKQEISIVSDVPGTTTDPVEKAYELQPIGPVLFIDTAGIDDTGNLGEKRIERTYDALNRTDLAIYIITQPYIDEFEEEKISQIIQKIKNTLIVINKCDMINIPNENITKISNQFKVPVFAISCTKNTGIDQLILQMTTYLQKEVEPKLIEGIIKKDDLVLLVTPIDEEAPKGRMILPQMQTIREILDVDAYALTVKENNLEYVINNIIKDKPSIVITDSQAFKIVDEVIPKEISLTSFSILFARQKGKLESYIKSLQAIENLKDKDKILIAELCAHHAIGEDIGRIKIPNMLKKYTGKNLEFDIASGKDYPKDLSEYSLIIQCGGCMVNRQLIVNRIDQAEAANIPITNYGLILAFMNGIIERAIKPFMNL
jgi:[FeFe] hydrogenase H-cluster maturation GTPase HydF